MILRNKTRVHIGYGSFERILDLPSNNKGKILYFNFETLNDVGTLSTQNLFNITASGISGQSIITANTPNQYITKYHLEDAYIEINSQKVVIKTVNEVTGVIELYEPLNSTFTNQPVLNTRVLGSSIINRFNTTNTFTGSTFAYLYKISNNRWRLRSYATGTLFQANYSSGNSVFTGETRLNSLLCFGDGNFRKRIITDNQFVYGLPYLAIGGGVGGQLTGHLFRHGVTGAGTDVGFYDNVGGLGSVNFQENIGNNLSKNSLFFGTHAKFIANPTDIAPNGFTFGINRAGLLFGARNLLNQSATPEISGGLNATYQPIVSRGSMVLYDLYFEFSVILTIGYKNYSTSNLARLASYFRNKENII